MNIADICKKGTIWYVSFSSGHTRLTEKKKKVLNDRECIEYWNKRLIEQHKDGVWSNEIKRRIASYNRIVARGMNKKRESEVVSDQIQVVHRISTSVCYKKLLKSIIWLRK